LDFILFDASTKRTDPVIERLGERLRIVKGMPPVVADLCVDSPAA
jgi:hypothetical protein